MKKLNIPKNVALTYFFIAPFHSFNYLLIKQLNKENLS